LTKQTFGNIFFKLIQTEEDVINNSVVLQLGILEEEKFNSCKMAPRIY